MIYFASPVNSKTRFMQRKRASLICIKHKYSLQVQTSIVFYTAVNWFSCEVSETKNKET